MLFVLQHIACEHLGIIAEALEKDGIEYECVKLFESEAVPKAGDCSALIILGGPMNVYEEEKYQFLREEDKLIRKALARNIPMLGICLGAQLIAKAAGAMVTKGKQKEIGWYEVKLTDEGKRDEAFKEFEREFKVFQWHGDTFDIPKCAVKLASSELFQNQAFRLGNAYALQFHIEVTYEMTEEWIKEYEGELSFEKIDPNNILEESKLNIPALNKYAQRLVREWIGKKKL